MAADDDDMPSAAQVRAAAEGRETHPAEAHSGGSAGRLNWLRAAVLGANDGIVSVAGIVIGVAGATAARGWLSAERWGWPSPTVSGTCSAPPSANAGRRP